MRTINDPKEMQATALALKQQGKSIGVVPTMGYLHEGHLSLARTARNMCDFTILTIFVNPTQFAPGEDFEKYPRDFERDKKLCAAEKIDLIFHPAYTDIYHKNHSVYIVDEALSSVLCGASRPGHFRGVLTIVAKLFNLTMPDVAVFGQKDAQQAVLIRRMARDLNFPVNVVVNPIVREPDGLAMSSRNKYLSPEERKEAVCLSRGITAAEQAFQQGCRNTLALKEIARAEIGKAPSAEIEYVETVDFNTLQPVTEVKTETLLAMAVRFGKTRLIDNTVLRAGFQQTQATQDLARP